MIPLEIVAAIKRIGITQREAAELCDVNNRTFRRWVLGESPIHPSASRLLAVVEHVPGARQWIEDQRRREAA